jgi:hypothetical protein
MAREEDTMQEKLEDIGLLLTRIAQLAEELRADPDGHVRRSVEELRSAFADRRAVEPAVARVLGSVAMLRSGNQEGLRREFVRRAHGLDYLEQIVDRELLPHLRRLGFEV